MKPVDQTILAPPSANCMAACVASVMARPLWTVPNFVIRYTTSPEDWYERFTEWVASEGWAIVTLQGEASGETWGFQTPKGLAVIATGPSPRAPSFPDWPDMQHSIVQDARTGKLLHDPHPSRAGLAGSPKCWELLWRTR